MSEQEGKEERKRQSRRKKIIAAIIVLAVVGPYFLTASSQAWWPFTKVEEQMVEDTTPEEEIQRPVVGGLRDEAAIIAGAVYRDKETKPPRTGPSEWMAVFFAAIMTLVYRIKRERG